MVYLKCPKCSKEIDDFSGTLHRTQPWQEDWGKFECGYCGIQFEVEEQTIHVITKIYNKED